METNYIKSVAANSYLKNNHKVYKKKYLARW